MAYNHRVSACTIHSFQETGVVPSDEPSDSTKHIPGYDDVPDSISQELEKDCSSAASTSCYKKRDLSCKERELGDGEGLDALDGPDQRDSVTFPSVSDDGHRVNGERPKKVSTRRRRWALYYVLRFHVPSLVITLFLMVLYSRNWIWQAPGPSAEMQNALQFAAKIHEGLIIVSLTNIVLHRLRFLLLQGHGVPLGLLSSPFQLASPLYFMTGEFWGAVKSSLDGFAGAFTVLLVLVSLLLAMAIGPFSAIVMLPSYGLWSVPANYPGMSEYLDPQHSTVTLSGQWLLNNSNLTEHLSDYVAAARPQELYPMSLGPDLGITWSCAAQPVIGNNSYGCRNFFNLYFANIIAQSPELDETATSANTTSFPFYLDYVRWMATANITEGLLRSDGTIWYAARSTVTELNANVLGMATTPTYLTAAVIGLEYGAMTRIATRSLEPVFQKLEFTTRAGTPVPIKQPAVMTQCAAPSEYYSWDNFTAGAHFSFTAGLFPSFNLTADDTLVSLVRECSSRNKDGCMSYVDIQEHIPYPISTAALVINTNYDNYANLSSTIGIHVCVVSARWAEAESWAGIVDQRNGHQSWGVLTQDPVYLVNQTEHVDAADIVRMDAAWLNGLDVAPYSYDTNSDMLATTALSNYEYHAAHCNNGVGTLPVGISLMLASALSGAQCAFMACGVFTATSRVLAAGNDYSIYNFTRLRSNDEAVAAGDEVHVRTTYWIYTYGYGVRDSWLTAVGIAVLLFHAALVVAHVALILGWGFWTSDAWGSMGELVALALRSSPPSGLANASAGVSKTETWRLVAVVRERVAEDRLELVLGERAGGRGDGGDAMEKGISRPDAGHVELAVPRSDKKYG